MKNKLKQKKNEWHIIKDFINMDCNVRSDRYFYGRPDTYHMINGNLYLYGIHKFLFRMKENNISIDAMLDLLKIRHCHMEEFRKSGKIKSNVFSATKLKV